MHLVLVLRRKARASRYLLVPGQASLVYIVRPRLKNTKQTNKQTSKQNKKPVSKNKKQKRKTNKQNKTKQNKTKN